MIYSGEMNSAIDRAIQSLEKAHRLKKEEFHSRKVQQGVFSGSSFFFQPVNSLSTSVSQVSGVLKGAEEIFKFFFGRMQQEIERDPWGLLGKVALGSFGVGLLAASYLAAKTKVKK